MFKMLEHWLPGKKKLNESTQVTQCKHRLGKCGKCLWYFYRPKNIYIHSFKNFFFLEYRSSTKHLYWTCFWPYLVSTPQPSFPPKQLVAVGGGGVPRGPTSLCLYYYRMFPASRGFFSLGSPLSALSFANLSFLIHQIFNPLYHFILKT